MLINNRDFLRTKDRDLLNELTNVLSTDLDMITIENSKKDLPTLKIKQNSTHRYIHSKYDPESEARRVVDAFHLEDGKKHVILFGFGLGYHYEVLKERYLNISFTIYEPDINILMVMLNTRSLSEIFKKDSTNIIIKKRLDEQINQLQGVYHKDIQVFALPFYEKFYQQELNELYQLLVSNLKNKKNQLVTNISFQKRWTFNVIKNLPKIINTPNILKDVDEHQFKKRTAVIVSAGPSLDDEYNNLHYIKENGLAYIFSVGSAINALLEKNIYPDAILSYDPKKGNQKVLKKLKDSQVSSIPLIFGTTVGYETLANYPGPTMHMVINQDTVTETLISENLEVLKDASSIAVVTYQLLSLLGFEKVILVGQDLAVNKGKGYASGIEYRENMEFSDLISVKGVSNNSVLTNESFNSMREQLEAYIKATKEIKVINTSKYGANIEGTTFIPLEEVITNYLDESNIVSNNWWEISNSYNLSKVKENIREIESARKVFNSYHLELENIIENINKNKGNLTSVKLEKKLKKFDSLFKKLKRNHYYKAFLAPVIRVQIENLAEKSQHIKFEQTVSKKINQINASFGEFLKLIKIEDSELNRHLKDSFDQLLDF
ncbi:motility associated factor glycosyltransferase family protein [Gracilibacillus suaedae]|uniref:motility associated factor glycosyltransferase family protein n=1 Tax=Gracilibacillus suaedae TaxID=2820273 RepID=UPI001ABDF7DA|nr:6-hydroxymethylpterin diphosphokinase MptE-like protein [Gracilibacillus suaedae]